MRYKNHLSILAAAVMASSLLAAGAVSAAQTPTMTLTNDTSSISIGVSGADPDAPVYFYFPNGTNSYTNATIYASIAIGQTDSSGSFSVSVSPSSYGLNAGTQVYVSVDGAQSQKASWPVSAGSSGQSNGLSLSKYNVTLSNGSSATITGLNTSNALTLQSNSNPSIASAYIQQSNNSLLLTAMNVGSTVVSVCAGSYGCASVSVSVTAPTQTITFNMPQAYVIMGNSPQSINIYGPGSSYSLSNSNKDALSASLSGNSLSLQGLSTGQANVTVCSPGWNCGTLPVSILPAGSPVPYQASVPAPISSDLSQAPQLTSFAVSSSDSTGPFLGANNTLNINFGVNQTVKNMDVKIAGSDVAASQGSDGKYYIQYKVTGNESKPIALSISFTNLGGISNAFTFAIGGSSASQTSGASSQTTTTVDCPMGYTCSAQPSAPSSSGASSSSSASYIWTRYLYDGMSPSGVSDPDVAALQSRLKSDGYFSGPVTGWFGPLTKSAVQAFQTANGLDPLGVVGPSTRALLNQGK